MNPVRVIGAVERQSIFAFVFLLIDEPAQAVAEPIGDSLTIIDNDQPILIAAVANICYLDVNSRWSHILQHKKIPGGH